MLSVGLPCTDVCLCQNNCDNKCENNVNQEYDDASNSDDESDGMEELSRTGSQMIKGDRL